jgi:hypothetical protein
MVSGGRSWNAPEEVTVDWFWLLVVFGMFLLFAGLVALCAKVR